MNGILIVFAALDSEDVPIGKSWPPGGERDVFVVIGALVLVVVLLLVWALAIRKPRRRHRRHHHHRQESRQWGMNPDAGLQDEAEAEGKPAETRRRRRRREHRQRNPTLAQTGGLPPIREEKPPGDSPA
jgi:type VI protein secretion system component VasK